MLKTISYCGTCGKVNRVEGEYIHGLITEWCHCPPQVLSEGLNATVYFPLSPASLEAIRQVVREELERWVHVDNTQWNMLENVVIDEHHTLVKVMSTESAPFFVLFGDEGCLVVSDHLAEIIKREKPQNCAPHCSDCGRLSLEIHDPESTEQYSWWCQCPEKWEGHLSGR